MKNTHVILSTFLFILLVYGTAFGQSSDYVLDKPEQKRTIDSIGSQLKANYVFPEVATEMYQQLCDHFKKNEYTSITNPYDFASQLTSDLRAVSKDLHLRVIYAPDEIAEENNAVTEEERATLQKRALERMQRDNFGFKEVKILEGNIGYLDLRGFYPATYGGETAVAAMNYLSNADALVIDLRQNGGGSPEMIQLISSYLFDATPVHLNNFYWRPQDKNTQTWTLPFVPGKRRPDIPVYVLTSKNTFSAAEEFCYNLKNLERATLVGETTGGGANPGGTVNVTEKYRVWIPQGRAINPITNTNWEGTGVSPHIEVAAEEALERAELEALEKLMKAAKDSTRIAFYRWYLQGIQTKMNPAEVGDADLRKYVGTYGPRKITIADGTLFYQRENGPKYPLVPMGDHWFILEGLDNFRIEFQQEADKVVALIGHYDNGSADKSTRTP